MTVTTSGRCERGIATLVAGPDGRLRTRFDGFCPELALDACVGDGARGLRGLERQRVDIALAETIVDGGVSPRRAYLRWINASTRGSEVRLIDVDQVCYFQSDTKYTRVVLADDEMLIRMPLCELHHALDPERFWTIHRSTIVNAAAVAATRRDASGRLIVRLKQRDEGLRVSEANEARFRPM